MALPPGPRLPSLAQGLLLLGDPVGFLDRCGRRYGETFTVRLPGLEPLVYVANPEEVKRVFAADACLLRAGEANARYLEPVLGRHSLLTLDGDEHLRHRRLLLPPFHGERVRGYADLMVGATEREVASWPTGEPFALLPAMQRLTLEILLRAVVGVDEAARIEEYARRVRRLGRASVGVLPVLALRRDLGRLSPWRRFLHARAALDELVYDEIARRRADPRADERDDVLSLLLAARDEDGRPLSDVELRDELMTLITAGHETTATSATWAFERLTRTPAAYERLLADPSDAAWLDAVVKETLRLRPPLFDAIRRLAAPFEVAGNALPAGVVVAPAILTLQLDPARHPEPHAFRPERFLDGQPEPYSWIPFGGGVRRCLGAPFAQLELRLLVRTIAELTRLRPASRRPERARIGHVTLAPARGGRVVLVERRDGARAGADVGARAAALAT